MKEKCLKAFILLILNFECFHTAVQRVGNTLMVTLLCRAEEDEPPYLSPCLQHVIQIYWFEVFINDQYPFRAFLSYKGSFTSRVSAP